jgi:hypothetical protein
MKIESEVKQIEYLPQVGPAITDFRNLADGKKMIPHSTKYTQVFDDGFINNLMF